MKISLALSACLLLWAGCRQQSVVQTVTDSVKPPSGVATATTVSPTPLSALTAFINGGYDLPPDMLRAHFAVDSMYLTPGAAFKGITMYLPANRPYACVLLHYDDGMVCSSAWLFTLDTATLKSIAALEVESNCDADLSRDNYFMHYRRDNDTLLHTVTLHHGPGDDQPLLDSTIDRYTLLPDGRIVQR
ncbi:hypothetical protein [Chitinophaga varians]|uniref:hypothetical protein n=1 Tax=Chitinophaga varians TaxID=2202339 RepID=UPI00165F1912|nr:hypothetical protein [Chitinophaga varians]MBC9910204.1 hypothetical protein [Chitinophaga varians]